MADTRRFRTQLPDSLDPSRIDFAGQRRVRVRGNETVRGDDEIEVAFTTMLEFDCTSPCALRKLVMLSPKMISHDRLIRSSMSFGRSLRTSVMYRPPVSPRNTHTPNPDSRGRWSSTILSSCM